MTNTSLIFFTSHKENSACLGLSSFIYEKKKHTENVKGLCVELSKAPNINVLNGALKFCSWMN